MYIRQIAAATALYATLALFGALDPVPAIGDDAGSRPRQAAAAPDQIQAKPYVLETEILHLREENIIP